MFHIILGKILKLRAYILLFVQNVTCKDYDSRKQFVLEMFSLIEKDETYLG